MKKQTLKKRTKKFEEKECALSNKERKSVLGKREGESFFNNNYGITLIALVISIVLNAVAWSKAGNFLQKYKKTLANNTNLL